MPEEKPKCPECDTEFVLVDGKVPDKCAKCGFAIGAYQPFRRLLKAFAKEEKGTKASGDKSEGIMDWLNKL